MSRTSIYFNYGPGWQKKKLAQVKCLFDNIQILSPVVETSNDSNPTQEVFASPPRPYSPLPPLIIEEEPKINKHDEPEEYYDKLAKKMRRIYKKLFIENRNISSIDYGSNYSDSSVNDDSVENISFVENSSPDNDNFDSINEDREARQSSAFTKSNGYGADLESIDTTIIDVVNNTASTEDYEIISEEKESDSENIDGDGIRNEDSDNLGSSENKESSRARIDDPHYSGGEESHHSIIDDHEMTENEESIEPEDEQNYEKKGTDRENIDEHEIIEETSQTVEPDIVRIDDAVLSGEESHHSIIDDHEMTENEESREAEDEQNYEKQGSDRENIDEHEIIEETSQTVEPDIVRIDDAVLSGEESHHSIIDDHEITENEESRDAEDKQNYEKQGSDRENIDEHEIIEKTSQTVEPDIAIIYDPLLSGEESHHSIIDDHEMTENEESRDAEDKQNYEKQGSDRENIDEHEIIEETSQTVEPDIAIIYDPLLSGEESHHSIIDDHEMAESEESREAEDEQNYEKKGSDRENIDEHEIFEETSQTVEPDIVRIDDLLLSGEESHHSSIDDHEMSESDISNEPEDKKEGSVSGSFKSVILPTRFKRAVASHNVTVDDRIEVFVILEEIADPKTVLPFDTAEEDFEEVATPQPDVIGEEIIEKRTPQPDVIGENKEEMYTPISSSFSSAESAEEKIEESEILLREATNEDIETRMGSPHPIEQMRTPRRDLSHEKISITHRSHSGSMSEKYEHSADPQEPTALTSSTQIDTDHNMSELQTSNEMNEVLTSIFNESENKYRTPISGRKRKLVDKSIQTVQSNRDIWEDIRSNVFIGTPKIFRFCACTDHICRQE